MAIDYEIGMIIDSPFASEIENQIKDAYSALINVDDQMREIEFLIQDIREIDLKRIESGLESDPCTVTETIDRLNDVRERLSGAVSSMCRKMTEIYALAPDFYDKITETLREPLNINVIDQELAEQIQNGENTVISLLPNSQNNITDTESSKSTRSQSGNTTADSTSQSTETDTTESKASETTSTGSSVVKDIPASTDAVVLPAKTIAYKAMGVILKKYTLIRYKIKKIMLLLERDILKMIGGVLKWSANGKGSQLTAPLEAVFAAIKTLAIVITGILEVLGNILSFIDKMVTMNVKSASAALFPTPKSLKKQDIEILNVNFSVTNIIPDEVYEQIVLAKTSIARKNNEIKKEYVKKSSDAYAAAVAEGNFKFDVPNIELIPFDPEKIKSLVNSILQTLLDADALPRYEKLHIYNPRFLYYLVTGFEPKAHLSFGIPGFP